MYFDTMYQIEGMNIVANSLTWTSFDTFNDNKRVARNQLIYILIAFLQVKNIEVNERKIQQKPTVINITLKAHSRWWGCFSYDAPQHKL